MRASLIFVGEQIVLTTVVFERLKSNINGLKQIIPADKNILEMSVSNFFSNTFCLLDYNMEVVMEMFWQKSKKKKMQTPVESNSPYNISAAQSLSATVHKYN